MSQKYLQILALSAMIGSLGSSGAVWAALGPGETCESFFGTNDKLMKCFANTDDCYMLASERKCRTRDRRTCLERTVDGPAACDNSRSMWQKYIHSNCKWGKRDVVKGQEDYVVRTEEREIKDAKGKTIRKEKVNIMGKRDHWEKEDACIEG